MQLYARDDSVHSAPCMRAQDESGRPACTFRPRPDARPLQFIGARFFTLFRSAFLSICMNNLLLDREGGMGGGWSRRHCYVKTLLPLHENASPPDSGNFHSNCARLNFYMHSAFGALACTFNSLSKFQ